MNTEAGQKWFSTIQQSSRFIMAAAGGAAPLEAEEAEFQTSKSVKVSALCVCAAAGLVRRRPGCAGRRACMGAHGPARREKQRSCVLCGWSAAWPLSWPPRDIDVLSTGGCAQLAACSPTCYAWSRAARENRGLRVRVCVCLPTVNGPCSLDVKSPYTLSQNLQDINHKTPNILLFPPRCRWPLPVKGRNPKPEGPKP